MKFSVDINFQSQGSQKVEENINKVRQGFDELKEKVKQAQANIKEAYKQNDRELANLAKNAKKTANETGKAFSGSALSIKKVAGAVVAVIATIKTYQAVVNDFLLGSIRNFSAIEAAEAKIKTLSNSAETARKVVNDMKAFMKENGGSFDFKDIIEAHKKAVSGDMSTSTAKMKTWGDTAAANDKSLSDTIGAVSDAMIGKFKGLNDFGIKAREKGKQVLLEWTDDLGQVRTTIVENNRQAIESTLGTIFDAKYAGAMEEQAGTWTGIINQMKNQWEVFKADVGEKSGLFDGVKDALSIVSNEFKKMAQDSEFMNLLYKEIQNLTNEAMYAAGVILQIPLKIKELYTKIKVYMVSVVEYILVTINEVHVKWNKLMQNMLDNMRFLDKISDFFGGDAIVDKAISSYADSTDVALKKIEIYKKKAIEMRDEFSDMSEDVVYQFTQKLAAMGDKFKVLSGNDEAAKKAKQELKETEERTRKAKDEQRKQERHNKQMAIPNTIIGSMDKYRSHEDVLKDKLYYYQQMKMYQEAAAIEIQLYKKELSEKSLSSSEKSDLIAVKQKELQKQYRDYINQQKSYQIEYFEKTGNYSEAKQNQMAIYKDELIEKNYTIQQQQELEAIKAKELDKSYKEMAEARLNERLDLQAGFEQYMLEVNKEMADYAAKSREVMFGVQDALTSAFNTFFDSASEGFLNFKDLARNTLTGILQSIQQVITQMIVMKTIQSTMSYFGYGSAVGGSYANGGVFENGRLVPVRAFATGGIVSSPTYFNTTQGLGVMGEAGAEAIMPLTRKNGKLGVHASGMGGTAVNVIINNNSSSATALGSQDQNGNVNIDIIDKQLADRFMNGRSDTQKVMSGMYRMEKI